MHGICTTPFTEQSLHDERLFMMEWMEEWVDKWMDGGWSTDGHKGGWIDK